ncbi:ABC transporter ATP-binding protein [Microbacterium testaceum]|uniref:ABC transporter ATP-binding protein n=1 Tax=Microbacterium testaceum TaxID=2033 RepID=A0A147F152_MICTE|nr:ABC transporter ATP-binding protein [Microbacterium testaceum]KTR96639.1 ABC transporter ATP-binding protein [Microbacterium testaceum]
MTGSLLDVRGLTVDYVTDRGRHTAVRDVSLAVGPGRVTALVGESGSGKSTLGQAVLGLLPNAARVASGSIRLGELELLGLPERRLRSLRGARIGLVPQDPTGSLNPVRTVGASIAETFRVHGDRDHAKIRRRVLELLDRVGIDDPATRARQFPHELSGGMKQRVLIAAAIALEPDLIVADEPTSALDVTVQKTVLDLIDSLRRESGTGVLLITHDLAVAADRADEVVVLRGGTVQETGRASEVLAHPTAEYTRTLLADAPSLSSVVERRIPDATPAWPLIEVQGLRREYARRGAEPFVAVDDVSFTVAAGTTHALVGESGSGKTTTGRAVAGFQRPTAGTVRVDGIDVTALSGRGLRDYRRTVQLVYQNPLASLDPRQRVGRAIEEPLRNFGLGSAAARAERVQHQLEQVALDPALASRYPAELSGGQRQRVAIARALVLDPRVVVLDEAVSALDVTVQAQILRLLARLQEELGLTYLFISHDLAVVRQIADTVSVLRRGRQVETGPVARVFDDPRSVDTRQLLAAIPGTAYNDETAHEAGTEATR